MSKYSSEAALDFDTIAIGEPLPPLTKRPTPVGVTLFCAAIRNFHRLHFDDGFARAHNLDGAIVPGFLIGNWCVEAATRAFAPTLRVARLRFRNQKVAYIQRVFQVQGHVGALSGGSGEERRATLDIRVCDSNGPVVAEAQVVLARKAGAAVLG